jgi:putative endonuclease
MKGCGNVKCYNKEIGSYGEMLSINYLIKNGYFILDKNYRNRFGEIDIVCKKDDILVFIEVKSRYTNTYGSPIESVTYYKQKQIIKISKLYITLKKYTNIDIRYDVIEVVLNNKNQLFSINHISDAFRTY